MNHYGRFAISKLPILLAVALASLLLVHRANSAPMIASIETSSDYLAVTVTFSDDVEGTGPGDLVGKGDVSVDDTAVSITSVDSTATVVVINFDSPVAAGKAHVSFDASNFAGSRRVPLFAGDWDVIEPVLRNIPLPHSNKEVGTGKEIDVPIASAWLESNITLGVLLNDVATSNDIQSGYTIERTDSGFSFGMTAAETNVSQNITAGVDVGSAGGTNFGISLSADIDVSMDIAVGGTIELDFAGATTSGELTLELSASASPSMTGTFGFVEASAATTLSLNAHLRSTYDATDGWSFPEKVFPPEPQPVATATVNSATIADLFGDVDDMTFDHSDDPDNQPLLEFRWPTIPTVQNKMRAETATVDSASWKAAGLEQLSNISIRDLLGAPGGMAAGLMSSQDGDFLRFAMPMIDRTLGQSVGIAETLAVYHEQIALAVNIAEGPFDFDPPVAITAQNICTPLRELRVRAEEVEAAIEHLEAQGEDFSTIELILAGADRIKTTYSTVQAVIDKVQADADTSAFSQFCDALFQNIQLNLDERTVETVINIANFEYKFINGDGPELNLGFERSELEGIAIAASAGAWTGKTIVNINFPLGVKLADTSTFLENDAAGTKKYGLLNDLENHDLNNDDVIDEKDITVAHRIYVPELQPLATGAVSIQGSGIKAIAQLGFLDISMVSGSVTVNPTLTLTSADPKTGFDDGKLDLAEFLVATVLDPATDKRNIGSVLSLDVSGDNVDAHFEFKNELLGVSADVDVVGDIRGAFPPGKPTEQKFDFRTEGISETDVIAAGTLAIGHTFADSLSISKMTPSDVIALIPDLLDQLADNATKNGADQKVPIIDVSIDEMLGFTQKLEQISDFVRENVPSSIDELVAVANEALAEQGMDNFTLTFSPGDQVSDPELILKFDASLMVKTSYPLSFHFDDDDDPNNGTLSIAPADDGASISAMATVDFMPELGIRFGDEPVNERVFVQNIAPRFNVQVNVNDLSGGVRFGPLAATVTGTASVGDAQGGFIGTLKSGDNTTIFLKDFLSDDPAKDISITVSGSLPVHGDITLNVPQLGGPLAQIAIDATVPGPKPVITTVFKKPDIRGLLKSIRLDLGTLATGAIETALFMARGADEISDVSGGIPAVGPDVVKGFNSISDLLEDVAQKIDDTLKAAEADENDPAMLLQSKLVELIQPDADDCPGCEVRVFWTGIDGEEDQDLNITSASGIKVELILRNEKNALDATKVGLGLEPLVDLKLDVGGATAKIGYEVSIGMGLDRENGFFLYSPRPIDADKGKLAEVFASFALESGISLDLAGLGATASGHVRVGGPLQRNPDGSPKAGFPNGAAGLQIQMPLKLPFSQITNRRTPLGDVLTTSVEAVVDTDLTIDLNIRTDSTNSARKAVGLTLPIEFDWDLGSGQGPSFKIVEAKLDIGSIRDVIVDTLEEFNAVNPLKRKEIQDALDAKVPLLENKKMRTFLKELCDFGGGGVSCDLFNFLANTPKLVADLKATNLAEGDRLLSIGSFDVFPEIPGHHYTRPGETTPLSPPQQKDFVKTSRENGPPDKASAITTKLNATTAGMMSMPILTDFPAIMGIILGGQLTDEVDFVRFEIPKERPVRIGPSINRKQTLSLSVSFLASGELTVALNGGIGLALTGGFGYSSRGIQTRNPLDGIYLIDGEGTEVSIGASVFASVNGSFRVGGDFKIAEVRFRGGGSFSATAGLDLFDESPALVGRGGGDGKLYFDEIDAIQAAYRFPGTTKPSELDKACMFQLQTSGTWSLSFSGKAKILGITVFNKSYSNGGTLWNASISCQLRSIIARFDEQNSQVILNAGPEADQRFDSQGDIAEKFEISINENGKLLVEWVGEGAKPSQIFDTAKVQRIVANLGEKDDSVEVNPNVLIPLIAKGGLGNDTLKGGGGPDELEGGPGDDVLHGGPEDDIALWLSGNDEFNGDDGLDTLTIPDNQPTTPLHGTGPDDREILISGYTVEHKDVEAIIGVPPTLVDPIGPITINEGDSIDKELKFIDWGAATWDMEIDWRTPETPGWAFDPITSPPLTEDSFGPSTSKQLTGAGNFPVVEQLQHRYDDNPVDPGTVPAYTATACITDQQDGGTTCQDFNVTVQNVKPVATLDFDPGVGEGSGATVALINQIDPSNTDTIALFCYQFAFRLDNDEASDPDFDDKCDWANPDSLGAPVVFIPEDLVRDGIETGTAIGVHARIQDKDDGKSNYEIKLKTDDGMLSSDLEVANVDPQVIPIAGSIDATLFREGIVFAEVIDPGNPDPFVYTINWGDGTSTEPATLDSVNGRAYISGKHSYSADSALRTITITVTDDDGGKGTANIDVPLNELFDISDAVEWMPPFNGTFTPALRRGGDLTLQNRLRIDICEDRLKAEGEQEVHVCENVRTITSGEIVSTDPRGNRSFMLLRRMSGNRYLAYWGGRNRIITKAKIDIDVYGLKVGAAAASFERRGRFGLNADGEAVIYYLSNNVGIRFGMKAEAVIRARVFSEEGRTADELAVVLLDEFELSPDEVAQLLFVEGYSAEDAYGAIATAYGEDDPVVLTSNLFAGGYRGVDTARAIVAHPPPGVLMPPGVTASQAVDTLREGGYNVREVTEALLQVFALGGPEDTSAAIAALLDGGFAVGETASALRNVVGLSGSEAVAELQTLGASSVEIAALLSSAFYSFTTRAVGLELHNAGYTKEEVIAGIASIVTDEEAMCDEGDTEDDCNEARREVAEGIFNEIAPSG